MAAASCNLGTDVGGTFTDLAWCTPSGELHCFKVPSTPSRPGQSILEGVDELFGALAPDTATWQSVHHTHSSTVATNALIERRGARIGLITTAGFRDVFELQRLAIPHPMRFDSRRPEPLVPRALVREVRGRIGPDGVELEPLDEADVIAAAHALAGRRRRDRRRRPDPQLSQSGARAAGARHRGAARTAAAPGTVQRDLAAGARVRAQRADRAERVDPSDRRGLSRSPDRGSGGARPRPAAARRAIERRRRTGDHAARASGRRAAVRARRRCRRCRRHGGGRRLDRGRSDDARCRRHQRRYRRDPRAAGRC